MWLVIGIQAAGKSAIADLLARRFDSAVHVRGGQFYRWATSGWVHPTETHAGREARRLLDLRYRLSARVADEYCADGFTIAGLDDHLARTPWIGLWLDTSSMTPEETVDEILARRDEALID